MAKDPRLEPALVEQFRRDGFVVIDGLLSEAELDFYEPLVTDAVATRKRDAPPLEEPNAYAQSFHQCINLWEDYPAIRPLTFHPALGQAATELLGVDGVRLWHDQALYKEAGGRATDAHQDHPYWPIVETASVTAWIPFRGSTLASGAMGISPGPTTPAYARSSTSSRPRIPSVLMDQPEIRAIEPVYVEVPKGSVRSTTDSPCTWRSRTQLPARPRRSHDHLHRRRRDAPERHWHFSVDRDGIEVGAPINGAVTPIVWPRPAATSRSPPPLPEAIRNIAGVGTLPEPTT